MELVISHASTVEGWVFSHKENPWGQAPVRVGTGPEKHGCFLKPQFHKVVKTSFAEMSRMW